VSEQALHLPIDVRQQVWESLVGMLRVYAHAAGLHGNAYVVTSGSDAASVEYGRCVLDICFSADTGAAIWRLTQPAGEDQGEFQIDEHGTLIFPDGPKELDTAAIDWIHQLGQHK
jgi:hypothetical protein